MKHGQKRGHDEGGPLGLLSPDAIDPDAGVLESMRSLRNRKGISACDSVDTLPGIGLGFVAQPDLLLIEREVA